MNLYLRSILNLQSLLALAVPRVDRHASYLVEVLQEIDDTASDLFLTETRRRSIAPYSGDGRGGCGYSRLDEGGAEGSLDGWSLDAGASLSGASDGAEERSSVHRDGGM